MKPFSIFNKKIRKIEENKKHPYNVTLDEREVKKAEEKIKENGGKISTLINQLLKEFNSRN